jgi:hypothetical protein
MRRGREAGGHQNSCRKIVPHFQTDTVAHFQTEIAAAVQRELEAVNRMDRARVSSGKPGIEMDRAGPFGHSECCLAREASPRGPRMNPLIHANGGSVFLAFRVSSFESNGR